MRLLLDAHTLLWHKSDDPRLSHTASEALETPDNDLFLSMVTLWELALKESLGKLEIEGGVSSLHEEWLLGDVADPIQLLWRHIQAAGRLPWIHRDPFDRLLVAQSLQERLAIVTCDQNITRYPNVEILW